MKKRKEGRKSLVPIKRILIYFILALISFALLFPMLYMLCNSFMDAKEISDAYAPINESGNAENYEAISFKFIPEKVSFMQYYQALLRKPRFLIMFWNSVFIAVPVMIGQITVSVLGAYAFAKLRFPFRDVIFFIYIIVMMMPFQVTLVPNYIMLKKLNLLGSFAAVILPGVFTTFGVFLLRQFMMQIPDEYCEAAKIDGAGYFKTFAGIILPNCKGAVASLAILIFIDNWNIVEQPLIFLKEESMYPLSIFLSRINGSELGIAFACGIIYMLPALFVFMYGENYLVEGIQRSGLK